MTRVESRASGIRIPHLRWYICGLVFIATVINYLDRQVFSILAPQLQKEIGWSELEYGRIVIAFQVAYATMMLISGRIIDRIGTKLSFSMAVVAWSLVEMAHALARSAFGFGVARFFLALTEAANFPAASKAVSEWFGPSERAFATGIFISGVGAGAIVASLMVPPLAASVGWQWTFVVTGLMGFGWFVLWTIFYRAPQQHPWLTDEDRALLPPQVVRGGRGEGAVGVAARLPRNLGLRAVEVADRSDLLVPDVLAARSSSPRATASAASRSCRISRRCTSAPTSGRWVRATCRRCS